MTRRRLSDDSGQSLVELAVAWPFLVLMTVGTFAVGIVVDRYLTVGEVVRNGGNMYARGVKFDSTQNKQLLIDSGPGLDFQLTGGKTAVYLSLLTRAPATAIYDDGSGPAPCANQDQIVIVQRYEIGDTASTTSNMSSRVGTPTTFVYGTEGDVDNYFDEPSAVATGAPAVLANNVTGLLEDQFVYVIEVIHRPESIAFQGIFAPEYMYARAFF